MVRKIGGYEITGEIGVGGFGEVLRGLDPGINQVVAIKVMKPTTDPGAAQRFRIEAETVAKLSHQNIVTIFRFGKEGDTPFLVMEYLDGVTLHEIIARRSPISLFDKIEIMRQTAAGLHYAHERGIVHRDIKPANIMRLRSGPVKIMDFGIARLMDSSSTRLTQAGFMIGTIEYMAPEQFRSSEPDALCDIWAYGAVFYELLANVLPCNSLHPQAKADPYTLMHRITMEDPAPIDSLVREIPPSLARVVHKLLARDRESRYQALDDVLLDLAPIQSEIAKAQVPELIRHAESLAESNEIESALSVIVRALEVDGSNSQARKLRDNLRERARHAANRPKVEELLREAEEHERERRFETALSHLQSALKLDPVNNTLRARIDQVRKRDERAKKSDALLDRARERLDQGDLTTAHKIVTEAIDADPENAQAAGILQAVVHAMSERKRQKQLQNGLTEANNFIVIQAYDDALRILSALIGEVGAEPQVLRRIEEVRQLKETQDRKERVNNGIKSARELLKQEKFEDACRRLEELDRYSPNDPAIELLLNNARERATGKQLQANVDRIVAQANGEREKGLHEQALKTLEKAIDLDPLNGSVLTLQRSILDQLKAQRERQKLEAELEEIRVLRKSGRLADARAAADRLMALYPGDARAGILAAEIQRDIKSLDEKTKSEFERGLKEAKSLLESGSVENATSLLRDLERRAPAPSANEAVTRLFSEVERLNFDLQRQSEIERAVAEAKTLKAKGQGAAALESLRQLLRKYPGSPELLAEFNAIEGEDHWQQQCRAAAEALNAGSFEDALRIAEQLLRERPGAAEVVAVAESARAELDFRNLSRQLRGLMDTGEFAKAQDVLAKTSKRIQADGRLAGLAAEISKEGLRRKEIDKAQQALRAGNFKAARASVIAILQVFPEDDVALRLRAEIDSYEQNSGRRREIQSGRETFERHLRAREFDRAMAQMEQLIARYSDEPGLTEDLKRAREARDEAARRESYNKSREESQKLLTQRRYEDAARLLKQLLQQYPGDPLLTSDLQTSEETLRLQQQRAAIDERIGRIEALFKAGNAEAVLKACRELLAEAEEPRARELLNWAEKTLAHAREIRSRGKSNKPLIFGGAGAAALALGVAVYIMLPAKTVPVPTVAARLDVTPGRIAFNYRKGEAAPASQSIQIDVSGQEPWTIAKGVTWLIVSKSSGAGPAEVVLTVDPGKAPVGEAQEQLAISAGSVRRDVAVELRVVSGEEKTPQAGLALSPAALSFAYQKGGPTPPPQQLSIKPGDPAQPWSAAAADAWISAGRISGRGTRNMPVSVDASRLSPGDYSSLLTFSYGGKQSTVSVRLHVAAAAEAIALPPPPPPGPSLPALPPARGCKDGYTGALEGTVNWSGDMPPRTTVVLQRSASATAPWASTGGARGRSFPGCDVAISVATPGIAKDEEPGGGNSFGRLILRNNTASPITNIQFGWSVK